MKQWSLDARSKGQPGYSLLEKQRVPVPEEPVFWWWGEVRAEVVCLTGWKPGP
jgi:hypothetical protein